MKQAERRSYYEAYDDRYRQVHSRALQWFSAEPSAIVSEVIRDFALDKDAKMLEIGCGEGRDAAYLLRQRYDLLATDISREAIAFCKKSNPEHSERFRVLDCLAETMDDRFDFIYAVAVIHMLVLDEDRDGFYRFIREHLTGDGIALIGTMGDGVMERQSDISTAFELQERTHEATGETFAIAGTSCRTVSFARFEQEIEKNGLAVVKQGMTAVEPDFPRMMYAVVKRGE